MLVDVTKTERHQTVHEGRLSGVQFKELLLNAIRREVSPTLPHHEGLDLELTIGTTLMPTAFPDMHFTVTVDELYWRKPPPPEDAE